jgi:phosphatidylglycerophosphate synthase
MLDGLVRRMIDPSLDRIGAGLARRGVSADALTALGLLAGLASAGSVVFRADGAAVVLLLASRILDGLDGAVARATRRTDRGGFIDIVFDFAVYGAVPLAFVLRDPAQNSVAAAVLLFSFYLNGSSFLAFAAVAAKRRLESTLRGIKSIYFTAGLAEGTETIAVFIAMILMPPWFPILAYGFASLTLMSAVTRIALAWGAFRDEPDGEKP